MTGISLPELNLPAILRKYDLHPSKGLGQNFLNDTSALQQITHAANISSSDAVLEIGPGLGSLTRYLALSAGTVTAVELDRRLFPALEDILAPYKNVRLVQGDILKLDPEKLVSVSGYIVVANIPYYITSAIIRHLLEAKLQPARIVLTVQEEVAARICALPGKMSLLALSVQVYGKPTIHGRIPAGSFLPSPKVDSAILCVEIYRQPVIPIEKLDVFFRVIKAGFSQKRKTLRNALASGLGLPHTSVEQLLLKAKIDPSRRAETLTLEEWGFVIEESI